MQLTRLGPYEIDKPLGKGGMGSVYAAIDSQTGQRVAIKALTPHLAMADGFRERFEAEIESLKTLRHEGIVRLYGYGEQDGVLFYSMELVNGISLEDELKAGRRFNWREVTSIAIQLSLALKHAHDHGIVHRDIKPANILLADDDEHVKLADFGIARLFGTTQLTTAGGVLGTADYMSPEQAEGRPVTARCDQYSLGGVMYALLTGRPPFLAKNLPQMLQLQRFANPEPVRRYAPDTPEQLERVIAQLLAKDPADRFPNTQVLARHLQAMVIALSRPAPDDFALANESPSRARPDPRIEPLESLDITQAESLVHPVPQASLADRGEERAATATQEAATLAAEELDVSRQHQPPSVAPLAVPAKRQDRPARFTTVEEEEERIRAQPQRAWLIIALQLTALAGVLGGMAAFAMHLSQPPTADELYAVVSDRGDGDDNAQLLSVEREVDRFLELYANDPRSAELRRYKQRIELEKIERNLRRQARDGGSADSSLRPAEQLYLRAADLTETSPDEAVMLFQSLVDLYGPSGVEKNDDISAVLRLARQRLTAMRAELATRHERELRVLHERLEVAAQLSEIEPRRAAAMYRAIIELHEADDWAKDVVAQARARLEALDQK